MCLKGSLQAFQNKEQSQSQTLAGQRRMKENRGNKETAQLKQKGNFSNILLNTYRNGTWHNLENKRGYKVNIGNTNLILMGIIKAVH